LEGQGKILSQYFLSHTFAKWQNERCFATFRVPEAVTKGIGTSFVKHETSNKLAKLLISRDVTNEHISSLLGEASMYARRFGVVTQVHL